MALKFRTDGETDQRTPKGGAKKRGGGAKPHEETPHEKQFPTPLTSVRFAPLPLSHFS